jgi:two-component system sensor histidine kinase RegB
MTDSSVTPLSRETHSDWVRLQTFTLLRWMAISGQLVAILVAILALDLRLPLAACLSVVGMSVAVNLLVGYIFPRNQRLGEPQALALLIYDMAQLTLLLFLTGGLTNPFALLILAPVTIAAAVLQLRATIIVGLLGIAFVSALVPFHLTLHGADGQIFAVPTLYLWGFWLAIVVGIVFLGAYSHKVATEIRAMSDAVMAAHLALAREQKLTDLGGVVAAAAHELGTPLATIMLVSTEMVADLADRADQLADAQLIRDQADRCRDILRSMGQAGKDDLHMRQAPLLAVLREAAEPHMGRGKLVSIAALPGSSDPGPQPIVLRRPEIIHGLRNLVQNAVDFAASQVWVEAEWDLASITLRVVDDGPGFPPQMIGRIGDPFLRARKPAADPALRPGYEGMGLGLFIAKTLLERSGARIVFGNAPEPGANPSGPTARRGAVVELKWHRAEIESAAIAGLGDNLPISI